MIPIIWNVQNRETHRKSRLVDWWLPRAEELGATGPVCNRSWI